MIKRVSYSLLVLLLFILAGCKQDTDHMTLSPMLYDYAPLRVGHYLLYDVDSITYTFADPIQTADTVHYQIQELISDTFIDNLGNTAYRIEVSKRYDTTSSLAVVDRAWYCFKTRNSFEKVEDDLHFIKLIFPPVNGVTWNGNSYLPASDTSSDIYRAYAGWTYTYSDVNVPKAINGLGFDSAVVVTEINEENLINKKLSRETYAYHVGLMYKEWEIINKQDVSASWAAPNKATGFRVRMRLHAYGG
ncbi:MAG: hypothetical protein JST83_01155 [Bacteroidetes bacterium]|nr:hypothetical protein [Bacteroidota bacterium]